jgi:FkbM family methyltransferase
MQRCGGGLPAGRAAGFASRMTLSIMSLIPKSLKFTSLPALALAAFGRKVRKLTGVSLFKRVPVSFGDARMYLTPQAGDGFTFWSEIFDMNPYSTLFGKSQGADLLIDCGGNTGAVTCSVLCRNPSIRSLTFEPNPPTFERLTNNCRLNGLSERATLKHCAVGSEPGEVTIEVDPNNSMAVVQGSSYGTKGNGVKHVMPITTIDAAVAELKPQPQRIVMKVDIEGFEVEALKGAAETLKKVTHFVAECHSDALVAGCREILERAGFTCEVKTFPIGYPILYGNKEV